MYAAVMVTLSGIGSDGRTAHERSRGESSFSLSSTSATSSSRSSTRRSWKTFATPPTTGVRAPATSSISPQVMSPTAMTSTSSRTHRSLSYKIPAADQDMEDLTLGEMLTEAYRGQIDYFVQEGVSVSQSSSSVMFDGSGQPDGEMVDRSGKPDERNSSNAQIRTLLEEQRQTIIAEYAKKSVITNSKQLTQKKSADSFKDSYGNRNWNFVKLVNKVLQKWKNCENSRVLPSILLREENSSRTRTLSWNSAREYRNCKMK